MAAFSFITTFINGNKPAADWFNSIGKAFNALGFASDNDGKPMLPLSLDLGIPLVLGGNETTVVRAGPGTYTVASGKLLIVTYYRHNAGSTSTVTPAGGTALTLSASAGVGYGGPVRIYLTAGDAITLAGANAGFTGLLVDLPALPNTPARLLQYVSDTVSYTVPAGKRLLLTGWYGSTPGNPIAIDGVTALAAIDPGVSYQPGSIPPEPFVLTESQIVAGVTAAANVLVTGILY